MNKFYASRQPTSTPPFLPCLGPAVNKIYDIKH